MSKLFSSTDANRGLRGIPRLVQAVKVSLAGLGAACRNEEAFRQEILLVLIFLPLGLWLGQDGSQKALLLGSLLLVLVVELLNSAVEAAVDRIGTEKNEVSRLAKDMGSAAVLLALVNACVIWALVLLI
ncbi:MAG TPA: diacylglycerol kinase [Desulfonatronum sp.]|nr:diacylglycerol kinase [Desulfonatronum sp.]